MANLAFGKLLIENFRGKDLITNGNVSNYDGRDGFCESLAPCTFTIDLENKVDIKLIRFLLWDKDQRSYAYRLLTSRNMQEWNVHYDTLNNGYKGWQCFNFEKKETCRYIRIHGLSNTANGNFHIVEVEAHDTDQVDMYPYQNSVFIFSEKTIRENGDGTPMTESMLRSIAEIESEIESHKIFNQAYFKERFQEMRSKMLRVKGLEQAINSIKTEIVEPVKSEISRSNKIGNLSLIVGIIGGVMAVFSLAIYLFESFNK